MQNTRILRKMLKKNSHSLQIKSSRAKTTIGSAAKIQTTYAPSQSSRNQSNQLCSSSRATKVRVTSIRDISLKQRSNTQNWASPRGKSNDLLPSEIKIANAPLTHLGARIHSLRESLFHRRSSTARRQNQNPPGFGRARKKKKKKRDSPRRIWSTTWNPTIPQARQEREPEEEVKSRGREQHLGESGYNGFEGREIEKGRESMEEEGGGRTKGDGVEEYHRAILQSSRIFPSREFLGQRPRRGEEESQRLYIYILRGARVFLYARPRIYRL